MLELRGATAGRIGRGMKSCRIPRQGSDFHQATRDDVDPQRTPGQQPHAHQCFIPDGRDQHRSPAGAPFHLGGVHFELTGEDVTAEVCRVFPARNQEAFQAQVRRLAVELTQEGVRTRLRGTARAEAERLFDPQVVVGRLLDLLATAPDRRPVASADRSAA